MLAVQPALASAGPGAWSLSVPFSAPGRVLPSEPAVAVAPEGRAVVVWQRTDAARAPLRDVVQLRTRATPTAPFRGPRTVSARRDGTTGPVAAAAAGRRTLVGWTEDRSVIALSLPTGPRRPAVARIDEGAGAGVQDLRVAVAPTGLAVAVWIRSSPAPTLRAAHRDPATGAWSAPSDVGPAGAAHPALALAGDGSGVLVWERPGGLSAAPILGDGTPAAPAALAGGGGRAPPPRARGDAARGARGSPPPAPPPPAP
ncbi:MAG TPA: hypothetical protein PKD59_14135, partial [Miltoncostaeaceae bacterium]|nr:hypothetical protein [Miltoncostaeaceae bacterium]